MKIEELNGRWYVVLGDRIIRVCFTRKEAVLWVASLNYQQHTF